MAYTSADKAAMYETAQADLTRTALSLKRFSEDKDQFVNGVPSSEQEDARRSYQQLTEMIGRFAIEAKSNEDIVE